MIDLHTHSTASDGSLNPGDLIRLAAREGLSAIALSDHDTLDGLAEAELAAREAGIQCISAIELEVEFEPGEFHILGFHVSRDSGELLSLTRRLSEARTTRNKAIIEALKADGFPVDYGELTEHLGGAIGRPHIAQYLVAKKIVTNKQAAFDAYLAKGRPYYSKKSCAPLHEVIHCVKKAGGLVFIAHPMSLFVGWTRLGLFFQEWKTMGIDGIEAWHPSARVSECRRLELLAKDAGLRVSAGSDFHGDARPERRLGHSAGGRPISDDFLAALEKTT